MTTSASLYEGPIFYFCLMLYTRVMVIFTFPFSFYPLASSSCLKDHDAYIQLDVSWHRLLLLTSPKGEYVGRQDNKPLSFSVSGWNSITTSIAWVLAIMGDYEIVEYVSLLKSLLLTLSDVTINCNCLNDWDYSLLVPHEVFEPYLTLWIAYYLSIGNDMTKSIYVTVIRMIMMPSCPYFIFIFYLMQESWWSSPLLFYILSFGKHRVLERSW